MTRLLLAIIAFYRRWLSPALHAHQSRRMQVSANLLGVRGDGHRHSRPAARLRAGRLETPALPSLSRAEASIRSRSDHGAAASPARMREPFPPRTFTIGRAAARSGCPCSKRQEVSFARNSQSQSANAGFRRRRWWRRYALHHGLHAARARRLSRLPVLLREAQARAAAARANATAQSQPAASGRSVHARPAAVRPRRPRAACRAQRRRSPPPSRPTSQSRTNFTRSSSPIAAAQVKHWILKKYFDSAGKPLDMVQPQAAARFGLPLSFFTYEPALTTLLNQSLYQVTRHRHAAHGHRSGPGSRVHHLSLRGQRRRSHQDLPIRLELCGHHPNAG